MTWHNKESIQALLMRDDAVGMKAVGRALVVLMNRQTSYEQSKKTTRNHNERGFTPADARMGTEQARYFLSRGHLTERQLYYWRKPDRRGTPRIAKYWRQLLEEIKLKELRDSRARVTRTPAIQGSLPLTESE